MTTSASALDALADLAASGKTGEFVCREGEVEVRTYLQAGRVAWATTSAHPHAFAKWLIERAGVDEADYFGLLEDCHVHKLPLGETMVSRGLANWEVVRSALRHQVRLATSTLRALHAGEFSFAERAAYSTYDDRLTLDPSIVLDANHSPLAGAAHSSAESLLAEIDGALWVEVRRQGVRKDCAPPGDEERVPTALGELTLDDAAQFVALRSERGAYVGASLHGLEIWAELSSTARIGSAAAALARLDADAQPAQATASGLRAARSVGDAGDVSAPLVAALDRLSEIDAALVLSSEGEIAAGAVREGAQAIDAARALLLRRAPVFELGLFADAAERSLVTGEPTLWCFGAQAPEIAAGATLWLLANRAASQGLGWSALTSVRKSLRAVGDDRR